jgi:hypothetical protein
MSRPAQDGRRRDIQDFQPSSCRVDIRTRGQFQLVTTLPSVDDFVIPGAALIKIACSKSFIEIFVFNTASAACCKVKLLC